MEYKLSSFFAEPDHPTGRIRRGVVVGGPPVTQEMIERELAKQVERKVLPVVARALADGRDIRITLARTARPDPNARVPEGMIHSIEGWVLLLHPEQAKVEEWVASEDKPDVPGTAWGSREDHSTGGRTPGAWQRIR
jgi:hypothetical protein